MGCTSLTFLGGIAALVLLICGPGMLTMAFLNPRLHLHFDTGQMWAFAGATSIGLWLLLCTFSVSLRRGTLLYLAVAAFSVGAFWFCHFGLKTRFTEASLALYFPKQQKTAAVDKPLPRR